MKPSEKLEAYLERIERHNPHLNAYMFLRVDEARKEACESDKRLAEGRPLSTIDGWCVGVKANIAVQGSPHHAGIGAYKDVIAEDDATVISRLKSAGAIIIGLLNMHEGALGATTDNEVFGRTHNPWKPGYTPGGSSGGSGCAVAAGLCDFALGSDTMGSVRIPSAYCGVQGHKATTGNIPVDGVLALSHTLDHVGPHARTIAELQTAYGMLADDQSEITTVSLTGLKVGLWDGAGAVELTESVSAGLEQVKQSLSRAGSVLSAFEPPQWEYGKSRRHGLLISEREGFEIHELMLKNNPDGFSSLFRKLMKWGADQPQSRANEAYAYVNTVRNAAPQAFENIDVVIAPTAPQTSFDFSEEAPANQADFTAWANFAALPATAVYTGLSDQGLPLSCQVIGPKGDDTLTLGVAAALESLIGKPPMPPGYG